MKRWIHAATDSKYSYKDFSDWYMLLPDADQARVDDIADRDFSMLPFEYSKWNEKALADLKKAYDKDTYEHGNAGYQKSKKEHPFAYATAEARAALDAQTDVEASFDPGEQAKKQS